MRGFNFWLSAGDILYIRATFNFEHTVQSQVVLLHKCCLAPHKNILIV